MFYCTKRNVTWPEPSDLYFDTCFIWETRQENKKHAVFCSVLVDGGVQISARISLSHWALCVWNLTCHCVVQACGCIQYAPCWWNSKSQNYQSKNMALISLKGDVFPCFSPILIIKTDFTHWQASSRHHIITAVLRVDLIVHDGDLVAVFLSVPSACQWQANLQPLFQDC